MTTQITHKAILADTSKLMSIRKKWGRENPSEEEDEEEEEHDEVNHILPQVWHANGFLQTG